MIKIKNAFLLFAAVLLVAFEAQAGSKIPFKPVVQPVAAEQKKVPIVYHPCYNMSLLWGLESFFHPFDGRKYGKIAAHLKKIFVLSDTSFHKPEKVSEADLKVVHSAEYLESLQQSSVVERIAEVPGLSWFPNSFLQSKILDPMRYATQGTIDAAQLALNNGVAFNLSGGYHHARSENQYGGFCFFADIPLAIRKVREQNSTCKRILVVDLDAHRGNGVAQVRDKNNDQNTFIFDMFSYPNYPYSHDIEYLRSTDQAIPLRPDISEAEYLEVLEQHLAPMVDQLKPDLIIFNAGSDIYAGDQLGHMNVSADGIVKRDAYVFAVARSRNIPIMMTLSGGYSPESAEIVGRSIENLLRLYVQRS